MVFSIGKLSKNKYVSGSRPFIAAGTCKREDGDEHTRLISTVIEVCKSQTSLIGYPLFCIASDGESRRGSALTLLTHKRLLDPESELYSQFGKLQLMNLLVGDDDITADKDPKHVMKQCRNFSIRKSGVMIDGFVVTLALLRFHLQENKVPSHRIDYLLNPTDRQDVPLCYTLMKEIWSLPPPMPSDKPSFAAARNALRMLGSLFQHLTLPFVQVTLSLHEQLVHLSAAAHLATFLYTSHGARTKAMPSLTFKDIIILVKNAFFCVAKVKISTPDGEFYIILLGTDRLESTFGVVRSIIGNDANVDILTLIYRLSHAVECLNIFSEHPEWDRGTRRLKLRGIEDGNGDILSKVDHISPSSWVGDVTVRNVSLVTAWNLGHQKVEYEFASLGIAEAFLELEEKGHDLMFPFGQDNENDPGEVCEDASDEEGEEVPIIPAPLSPQVAMDIVSSTALGEGEGPMLDLEDHASIETARDGKGKFDPLVDVGNGRMAPKARALRELERAMFSKIPGSTDRLNRCAGLSRYTKTDNLPNPTLGVIDSTSNEFLAVGDPAATVIRCEDRFFLAVVQINEIFFDTSSILEINPQFLMEPAITVQFQIFQVTEISKDDPDIDGADWKWNQMMEKAIMKTKGSCIQVINPAVAVPQPNVALYFFHTDELRAISASLFSSISIEDRSRLPCLRKRTNTFPYRTTSGASSTIFLCS